MLLWIIGVFFYCLILVVVCWIFYPVIACRNEKQKPNEAIKLDNFYNAKGIIAEKGQIFSPSKCDISVVVPAYNEEMRLPIMLDETLKFMSEWSNRRSLTFEIVVVDDGSSDNTVGVVQHYMTESESIKLLKLGVNRGKGGAIKRGVTRCEGSYILMADADAATDIRDLDKMFDELQRVQRPGRHDLRQGLDKDIVGASIGSRAHMEGDSVAKRSLLRTILMKGFHLLVVILCTKNVKDTQCGFKLFTRRSARVLFEVLHLERWSFDTELVYLAEHLDMPLVEVAVTWHEVDGSKLIQSVMDVATTSLTMARDMLCVRLSYLLGIWSVSDALIVMRGENEKKSK